MNGTGSTALADTAGYPVCPSKCRCGALELPEVPAKPSPCPPATGWPTLTCGRRIRWQYRVTVLSGCRTSTYHPQPASAGDPSTSHEWVGETLHSAVTTIPAAAARTGLLRCAPRSTPLWWGLRGVRKPPQIAASVGRTQALAATAQAASAGPGRLTYASETNLPSPSLSQAVVVRTTPAIC